MVGTQGSSKRQQWFNNILLLLSSLMGMMAFTIVLLGFPNPDNLLTAAAAAVIVSLSSFMVFSFLQNLISSMLGKNYPTPQEPSIKQTGSTTSAGGKLTRKKIITARTQPPQARKSRSNKPTTASIQSNINQVVEKARGSNISSDLGSVSEEDNRGEPFSLHQIADDSEQIDPANSGSFSHLSSIIDSQTVASMLLPSLPENWNLDLINNLEWRVFDRLTIAYWRARGNSIIGVRKDKFRRNKFMVCSGENKSIRVALIQSHSPQQDGISIVEMQTLLKQKSASGALVAMVMYVGELPPEIRKFCDKYDIRLIDADGIYQGLMALPPSKQVELFKTLIHPDYMVPTCPNCRVKMVRRRHRQSGLVVWGCISSRSCKRKFDFLPC